MSHAVEAQNVFFSYGRRLVLRDISLLIGRGEFVGVAGPNGAGKTTLLLTLTGYLQPQRGAVFLDGAPVALMSRREAASRVAFVAQKTEMSFPFRVLEVVLMGRHPYAGLAALDSARDVEAALRALERLDAADLADKQFNELSGGEQQLVLLARALAQETPVLILDEPTSFLDFRRQWNVLQILAGLRQCGVTIVATFHDLNVAARWCSQLVLLHNGVVAAAGRPGEVLTASRLESLYGIPLVVDSRPSGTVRIDYP
jgi:iron complex transport system ATP-binding protein